MRYFLSLNILYLFVVSLPGCGGYGDTGYYPNTTGNITSDNSRNGSDSTIYTQSPPTYPSSVTLYAISDKPSTVELQWTPLQPVEGGYYTLYRSDAGRIFSTTKVIETCNLFACALLPPPTLYIDENLQPDTEYCYKVSAFGFGSSEFSNEVCINTSEILPWTRVTLENWWEGQATGTNIDLDLDAANSAHISYRHSNNRVIYSTNQSGSWRTPKTFCCAWDFGDSAIDISSLGYVHIIYGEGHLYPSLDENALHFAMNQSGVWADEEIHNDGQSVMELAIDSKGSAHISARLDLDPDNSRIYLTNSSGSWQKIFEENADDKLYDTDIKLDSSDNVHIVYSLKSRSGDTLCSSVNYANNTGGSWENTVLDTPPYFHCTVALDIGPNNRPHIVYTKHNNHIVGAELIYLTRDSHDWTSSIVDNHVVIADVSIDVDNYGGIHISYQGENNDLKYAYREAGGWQIGFVDTVGDIGSENVIKVDPAGRVNLLYTDDTNGTIKFANSP